MKFIGEKIKMNDKTDSAMEEMHNTNMRAILNDFIYKNLTNLLPFNTKICDGIEFRFESIFKKPDKENKFHSRLTLRFSDVEIREILNNNIHKMYGITDNKNCKKHEFIGHIKNIETQMINDRNYSSYHKFNELKIMVNSEDFPDISKIEYAEIINSIYNGMEFKAKRYKITLEEMEDE